MGRRFALALVCLAVTAAPAAAQPRTNKAVRDSLQTLLTALDAQKKFHGVVLLAEGGKIVHHTAHGLAHQGYQVPNRPDTKFNLASVGKTFTAVAIGQLVEQGKLRFTDTLIRILPNYPNPEIARKVTIARTAKPVLL